MHMNVPGWLAVKAKVGRFSLVRPVGPEVIVVSGSPAPSAGSTGTNKNARIKAAHTMPIRVLTRKGYLPICDAIGQ